MSKHIFVGNVLHNGQSFLKGQLCPEEIKDALAAKGLVVPVPEAPKPIEAPVVAPKSRVKAEK